MNNSKNYNGFTLIEAIVTMAVTAILLSIAIPSFSKMIERNRITSATNEFIAAIMLTRSEAVTHTIPASICTSDNGITCSTTLDDYAKGWIIFSDCNMDGLISTAKTNCDFNGDGNKDPDRIIKVHNGIKKLSILAGNTATEDYFTYQISGRPNVLVGTTFRIGADPLNLRKKLTIALTGRVKLCTIGHTGCP